MGLQWSCWNINTLLQNYVFLQSQIENPTNQIIPEIMSKRVWYCKSSKRVNEVVDMFQKIDRLV